MRIGVTVFVVGLVVAGPVLPGSEVSLEDRVKAELEVFSFDTRPPYVPLDKKLLQLGERREVSRVLLSIVQKNRNARAGVELIYLIRGVQALRSLQEREALPLLASIAIAEPTADLQRTSLKLQALLAIGEIDARGNQALLLRALKDPEYSVRKAAAQGLSRIEDSSVLTELEVAASQEPSRETGKQIQAMADDLRTRMNSRLK